MLAKGFPALLLVFATDFFGPLTGIGFAKQQTGDDAVMKPSARFEKKINFVYAQNPCTPTPAGWEEYDGSIYDPERGYGWLIDLSTKGRDRCAESLIRLEDGTETSAKQLGRPELANWQGKGTENQPIVFRVDLPNGWYRIACASVDPGVVLPVVDQRSFKCRANDAVLAGPRYGRPLAVPGNQLISGAGTVEVTEDHLRIIVGDVAYGGWVWSHEGPWYQGWARWIGRDRHYANGWYQQLVRRVDPGFHMLRLNALEIEAVEAPRLGSSLIFSDHFNRDDDADLNHGIPRAVHWLSVPREADASDPIRVELAHGSAKLTGSGRSSSRSLGLIQSSRSPEDGVIRYSTGFSLFTGEGSSIHSGSQEAGLLLLADRPNPSRFHGTSITVLPGRDRPDGAGRIIYRVGDEQGGYRSQVEIPGAALPFALAEGEYEIAAVHDVRENRITQISVNGFDITHRFDSSALAQPRRSGVFGIFSTIDASDSEVRLKQHYWYYRVERSLDIDGLGWR